MRFIVVGYRKDSTKAKHWFYNKGLDAFCSEIDLCTEYDSYETALQDWFDICKRFKTFDRIYIANSPTYN